MPLYDYRCEQGHEFEVSQSIHDEALDTCAQCGAPAVRLLHSPAASVAGASTYGSNYSARPKEEGESPAASEEKDDGPSWIESAERRKGPDRTFRRGLRRN